MNSIDLKLQKLAKSKQMGLMTHVVVGYPTIEDTLRLVETLVSGGSDFIELQIPFSDPVADGPIIMQACEVALENGATTKIAFELAGKVVKKMDIPLLFMCYYNTLFRYGVEKFCQESAEIGISGLIVPDIPLDEEKEEHFIKYTLKYNLYPIRVISPASTHERLIKNAEVAKGFVYYVSHFGITGSKLNIDKELEQYIRRVKRYFKIPIALGFGISKPTDVRKLSGKVDIAVVGSALIKLVNKKNMDSKGRINYAAIAKFVRALKV